MEPRYLLCQSWGHPNKNYYTILLGFITFVSISVSSVNLAGSAFIPGSWGSSRLNIDWALLMPLSSWCSVNLFLRISWVGAPWPGLYIVGKKQSNVAFPTFQIFSVWWSPWFLQHLSAEVLQLLVAFSPKVLYWLIFTIVIIIETYLPSCITLLSLSFLASSSFVLSNLSR